MGQNLKKMSPQDFVRSVAAYIENPESPGSFSSRPGSLPCHTGACYPDCTGSPGFNGPFIIGIDGRCASGKTTVSRQLASSLSAAVIPMDAFFIPAAQRSSVDFSVPGANFDRERFLREVVPQLRAVSLGLSHEISYIPFDCHTQTMLAPVVRPVSRLVVVEGSYSLHPALRDLYNLKVFCDIGKSEQLARLVSREGREKAEVFVSRWIPLEELYFSATATESAADIVLS